MDQKARTGKKLQVKKTVLKSLMDTKEILTCQDGTLAVSYTHLDVYKRQMQPVSLLVQGSVGP